MAVGAVALAVGRFLPGVTHSERLAFEILGVGYGLLAVVILVVGALRQRATTSALGEGRWTGLTSQLVTWLTAAAIVLSIVATVLVAVKF